MLLSPAFGAGDQKKLEELFACLGEGLSVTLGGCTRCESIPRRNFLIDSRNLNQDLSGSRVKDLAVAAMSGTAADTEGDDMPSRRLKSKGSFHLQPGFCFCIRKFGKDILVS